MLWESRPFGIRGVQQRGAGAGRDASAALAELGATAGRRGGHVGGAPAERGAVVLRAGLLAGAGGGEVDSASGAGGQRAAGFAIGVRERGRGSRG